MLGLKEEKEYLKTMNVPVKVLRLSKDLPLPIYEKLGSAGMDVHADIPSDAPITIEPHTHALISTGLRVEIPTGYEIQVRPRSGLALKFGIEVVNSPGTIDSDYRGVIGVILKNDGDKPFIVNRGDRIAQIVLNEVPNIEWVEVESDTEFTTTDRGEGGFGHTKYKAEN